MAMIQAMLPLLSKSQPRPHRERIQRPGVPHACQPARFTLRGFGDLGYNTSKPALNSMTVQFAKELKDTPIKVNAICPGYCATDINGNSGPRSAAQGAVAAIEYATIGADGPTGGYFNDEGRMPW